MQENMAKTFSISLLSLCLLLHSFLANCTIITPPLVPALYIFGDSLVDSGNNNQFPTSAKVNYLPYGIDFPNGPTGRFTNGKTSLDFIANFLGLPFIPPYNGLSIAEKGKTITGINYASASAGILRESGTYLNLSPNGLVMQGRNVPLGVQIESFKETINLYLPQNFQTNDDLSQHLSDSIFAVVIGGNDYINNYLMPTKYNSSHLYDPNKFAGILLQEFTQHLKNIYNLGARKFLVYNLSPIGCIPAMVQLRNVTHGCADDINDIAAPYNVGFPGMLEELRNSLPGSTFVQADIKSSFFLDHRPFRDGIIDSNPCCLTDNETHQCLKDVPPCTDRFRHVFWDAIHPTQTVNSLLSIGCFFSHLICTPMNVLDLALL
ncbi:GDSL esterase/lipase 7-like [Telopea speciosissima]|uniref:GDSL esterase/lipase 7-like n=1 Tax=Telopea speciosissima TaxID=54955 RepID=UPI001CC6E24E|nr:GDSL esterase/lipase 7-like [Telopea speciosissima]